jgi:hypothetical protein
MLQGFVAGSYHYGQGNNLAATTLYDAYTGNLFPGLPIDWGDHAMCWYQEGATIVIFDPSYGVTFLGRTLEEAELSWEQASVVGFCWLWRKPHDNAFERDYFPYDYIRNNLKTNGPILLWEQ